MEVQDNGALSGWRLWGAGLPWPLRGLARIALGPRRALWLAVTVVIVPLLLMLGLQYLWLVELERKSAMAHYASLSKQLELLTKEIAFHFVSSGERTLRVPPWLLTGTCECYDKYVADHAPAPTSPPPTDLVAREAWLAAPFQGARVFFVASFVGPEPGRLVAFDMRTRARLSEEQIPPAMRLAVYYWQIRVHKSPASVHSKDIVADETDPENPMLLAVIADENSRVVGVTGMVVDTGFFVREILPSIVQRVLPSDEGRVAKAVTVWDGTGKEVWAASGTEAARLETKRKLAFVLTHWMIALGGRGSTGAQMARTSFFFNLSLAAVLAGALFTGIVFAMRTAAREMKLSEMKSDFVSNVSHELRTPLSSIRVFGEMMRLGRVKDPAKVQEYGAYIEDEGRRLSRLIDNILDFSRIEAGRKVYRAEDQDLVAVVRDVLGAVDVRLRREGFAVELITPAEPLPLVCIDASAIGHALTNLLDNAAKYSGSARRIVVTLKATRDEVSVAVRDFGIGIAREEHERIFDRFHRVGTGLVHDVKGSGLGLAIVKHIVEAHGGHVTVESALGTGSQFVIHLPSASNGNGGERAASAPEAANGRVS